MEKKFSFSGRYKSVPLILALAGIITMVFILFTGHDHGSRFWSNFLLNNVFFVFIALSGMVFLSLHALGTSGWQTSIQRIPEAMTTFLPVGFILMMILLFGMWTGHNHVYHWTHPEPGDTLIEMKKPYLNLPFFSFRAILYLSGWTLFAWLWRKNSLLQDSDNDFKYFKRTNTIGAAFMVFFAITSSMAAWDWIMSVDPHWFSTLFGWYVFSSLLVCGIAVMILLVLFLKWRGFLPHVNKEHIHDLGMYLFAFSVFWAYLWFSQYMLIWYGNLPEETTYYVERLTNFRTLFFLNLILNFLVPFLALMARNSKRMPLNLALAAIVVFAGHWVDFYLMIMPASAGEHARIGLPEIGMTIGYAGLFLFVFFRAFSRADNVPRNHPYFKESFEYHTQY